jgi:hypothetical protein
MLPAKSLLDNIVVFEGVNRKDFLFGKYFIGETLTGVLKELGEILSGTSISESHAELFLAFITEFMGLYGYKGNIKSRTRMTPEGGFAVKLKNGTGAPTIKGTLVQASSTSDLTVKKMIADESVPVGVIYDNGIADGEDCWIVVSGLADFLLEDGTGCAPGNWAVVSENQDGRISSESATPPPSGTIAEIQLHFKEVGHCLETKNSGTDVLARCVIHFN